MSSVVNVMSSGVGGVLFFGFGYGLVLGFFVRTASQVLGWIFKGI